MIARLWLPLQLQLSARMVALGAGAVALWATGATELIVVSALLSGALAFSAGARSEGHYAYAAGTGYLWLSGQLALVGTIPIPRLFGAIGLALVLVTVGLLPFVAARTRGRTLGTRLAIASPRARWIVPATVAASGALVFALVSPADGGEASGGPLHVWPWALGWIAVWTSWRQSVRESVAFTASILALCLYAQVVGGAPSMLATGLSLSAPLALRLSVDQRAGPGWTSFAIAAGLIGGALLDPTSFVVGGGTCILVWAELWCPAPKAAGQGRTRLATALKSLPPYPRWYARAKLRSDPLFDRVQDAGGLDGSVLDIGCGMALAGALKSVSVPGRYVGLDIDPEKLRAGAHLLSTLCAKDMELRVADLRSWMPKETFDRVLLLDVLHYASMDEQTWMLSAACKVLAEDGKLLVRDPLAGANNDVAAGERWTTCFGFNPRGATSFLSRLQWEDAFASAGLCLESEHKFPDGNVLFVLSPC